MDKMNPTLDGYFSKLKQWQAESRRLRAIALDCGLGEELKWGKPCFTFQSRNIVLIQGFKEYCALLFFKGVLLSDADGLLVKIGENTQAGRQIRFTSVQEIAEMERKLKSYVLQAIEVEKSGLKVVLKKSEDFPVAEEFQSELKKSPALKAAFGGLTPGRQRGYLLYFSSAKQSATRASRVKKCIPRILKGKGLDDE